MNDFTEKELLDMHIKMQQSDGSKEAMQKIIEETRCSKSIKGGNENNGRI